MLPSKRVRKAIHAFKHSDKREIISALEEVTNLLFIHNAPARFALREKWGDHALKGKLKHCRELHLGFDQLLVYEILEERNIIKLIEIVTHEELKKWNR